MTSSPLLTEAHGKWILVGEHAALRGGPVLVFPLVSRALALRYSPDYPDLKLTFQGEFNSKSEPLFKQTLQHALAWLGRSLDQVQGLFELNNHIPTGSGLGASAALCVLITRFLIHKTWLDAKRGFEFARRLEDLFHGQSSGVDIVGVSASEGLWFQPDRAMWQPVAMRWKPQIYLSFSGHVASTATCVKQVLDLHQKHPDQGFHWDQAMKDSVWLARQALSQNKETGFRCLCQAIEQAYACFKAWRLVTPAVDRHIRDLLKRGASAAKPTGSGGGGYILSLWERPPTDALFLSQCMTAF